MLLLINVDEVVVRLDKPLVDSPEAVKDVGLREQSLQLGLVSLDDRLDLLLTLNWTVHVSLGLLLLFVF